jgi:histone acetyltransferase (RNA polymerase elongator complex component)
VKEILKKAVGSRAFCRNRRSEVAFYGGTFTRLPIAKIKELLEAIAPYLETGTFNAIRVSTRPDALNEKCLETMRTYGVKTVELGVQSMDNQVLSLSRRGHTAEDTGKAIQILKRHGFKVGVQLMPGLPGDSHGRFRETITEIIRLDPDMARLYPALVINGTELAHLHEIGKYQPLQLEQAVEICVESCISLESKGIPVIRIGLMVSPSLLERGDIIAGPWHPAFGFLVRSGIYRKTIGPVLQQQTPASHIRIITSKREIPLARGYRNQGLEWIERVTGAKVVGIQSDNSIAPGKIRIEKA